jgi:hypothetical protein
MWLSAVLNMDGSAIPSSSQPVPSGDSNSNSIDITYMTNMTSLENTGLVDSSITVEGAMWLVRNGIRDRIEDFLFVPVESRYHRNCKIVVNVIDPTVYQCQVLCLWNQNRDDA